METSKYFDILLYYLYVNITMLLWISCVFINGENVIHVKNDTCGTNIYLAPSEGKRFSYDGSKMYSTETRFPETRCEIIIFNEHRDYEMCIAKPIPGYKVDWVRKCKTRFSFSLGYSDNTLPCSAFTMKEKCENYYVAYAIFTGTNSYGEGDFEVKIFLRYKATPTTLYYDQGGDGGYTTNNYDNDNDDRYSDNSTTIMTSTIVLAIIAVLLACFCICVCVYKRSKRPNVSGRTIVRGGLSHGPHQLDMPTVPRSDSPPPYESLIRNVMDKHGEQGRNPTAPPLIGEPAQHGANNVTPRLPSAPPLIGDPLQNGSDSVPYHDGENENMQAYGITGFSASNNKANSQTSSHTDTKLPPPPPYDMAVASDSH